MKKCRHCRTENESTATLCSECGLPLLPSAVINCLTRVVAGLRVRLRALILVNRVPSAGKCFIGAFSLTCLFGVGANVVTYLVTRGAYNGDGFEIVGFPFVFRRLGGLGGLYEFRVVALLADLLAILGASFAVGLAFSRWCCQRVRHETGTAAS
jgi:hypothetical protein